MIYVPICAIAGETAIPIGLGAIGRASLPRIAHQDSFLYCMAPQRKITASHVQTHLQKGLIMRASLEGLKV